MFARQGVAQGRGPQGGHHVEFAHNYSGPAALDPDAATHVCPRPRAEWGARHLVLHSLRVLGALSPLVTLRPRFSQHLARPGSQAGRWTRRGPGGRAVLRPYFLAVSLLSLKGGKSADWNQALIPRSCWAPRQEQRLKAVWRRF